MSVRVSGLVNLKDVIIKGMAPPEDPWIITGSNLPAARNQHAIVTLLDGRMLIMGGSVTGDPLSGYSASTLIGTMSGDTITWIPSTNMPWAVRLHTATLLPDGRVVVAGGNGNTGANTQIALVMIGTVTGNTISWVASTSLPTTRTQHTSCLINGKVLLMGGSVGGSTSNSQILGTVTGDTISWATVTLAGNINGLSNREMDALLLSDNRILFAGGQPSATTKIGTLLGNTITWVTSTSMPVSVQQHTISLIPDGRVVLIGGRTSTTNLATVYYGTVSGDVITWIQTDSMPDAKYTHATAGITNGRLVATGGANTAGTVNNTVYIKTYS